MTDLANILSLEISAATLRYHPQGGGAGTPWDWCCRVSEHPERHDVIIFGAMQTVIPRKIIPLVAKRMTDLGYTRFRHQVSGEWYEYPLDRYAARAEAALRSGFWGTLRRELELIGSGA